MKELVVYCPDHRTIVIKNLKEIWVGRDWTTKWVLKFDDDNHWGSVILKAKSPDELHEALLKISEAYSKGKSSVRI